jgi:hypothetical protein
VLPVCSFLLSYGLELTTCSYRLVRSYFAQTSHWKEYDPFFESKAETYRSSSGAIIRESFLIDQDEIIK